MKFNIPNPNFSSGNNVNLISHLVIDQQLKTCYNNTSKACDERDFDIEKSKYRDEFYSFWITCNQVLINEYGKEELNKEEATDIFMDLLCIDKFLKEGTFLGVKIIVTKILLFRYEKIFQRAPEIKFTFFSGSENGLTQFEIDCIEAIKSFLSELEVVFDISYNPDSESTEIIVRK